jgi:nucleoside-diphosphate-sugar epimerase
MRALVTGSAGFIGRHMAAALEAAGYDALGIDLDGPVYWDALDFFNEQPPSEGCARMLPRGAFDVVVHAAAVVGGREVIDGDPLAQAVNLELDAAMFRWAARARPGRVVYLSSSAAYPAWLQHEDGHALPEEVVTLDGPLIGAPDQLYGWTKLTGEKLAEIARANGVPVTVVRPFSGFGEDQSTDYPFPAFAARARAREDPFTVWGDGRQVRDFVHVDDICAALLVMIREGIDGPVNLGTGRATSMRDLAAMMCAAAGYEPEIKTLPGKPSGVAYRVADVTRMREFYEPKVSLEEGVERALGVRF